MVSEVLVGINRPEYAERAVELAVQLFPDAKIHLLHVLSPIKAEPTGEMAISGFSDMDWYENRREQEESLLASLAKDVGSDITEKIVLGQPHHEIPQYVKENDIDHVIIGKGREGISRLLFGSIPGSVARRSPVPVTIAG